MNMRRNLLRLLFAAVVIGAVLLWMNLTGILPNLTAAVDQTTGQHHGQEVQKAADEAKNTAEDLGAQGAELIQQINAGGVDSVPSVELIQVLGTIPAGTPGQRIPEYRRDQFGPAWMDVDGNSCDTRNDILKRDLTDTTTDSRCRVLTGTLHDPYTGKIIHFVRGEKTSPAVQIDHIYSLSQAWENGAWQWTLERREQFANDPMNLLAVDGPTNQAKSDHGPANGLPPNQGFHCQYARSYVAVAVKYGLQITDADKTALTTALGTCAK